MVRARQTVLLAAAAACLAAAPSDAASPPGCAPAGAVPVAVTAEAVAAVGVVRPGFRISGPPAPDARTPDDRATGFRLDGVVVPSAADASVRARLAARLREAAAAGLRIAPDPARPDRHGRRPAVVLGADGAPLAVALAADGLVAADGTGPCAAALLKAEARARGRGAGLWAGGGPVVRLDADGSGPVGADFVIVEGRVDTVGITARTAYLNFGRRFARDVTVVIDGRTLAGFAPDNRPDAADGAGWAGRLVRLRGWAAPEAGGTLRLPGPEALERIETGGAGSP